MIQTDPTYRERIPSLGPWTYAVIVSRCHEVDKHLLSRLAREDLAYLGMIGSKSKARSMLREAEAEGVPRDRLSRVRAPIGLDLGKTKDPAAVALSILAEVTQVLHAARASSASPTETGADAAPSLPLPDRA